MFQLALENTHWQALTIKKKQKLVLKHWLKAHVADCINFMNLSNC